MKKWNIVAITTIIGLASAIFGEVYAAEKLKVGFIYIGPIADFGRTYQHDLGRKAMEKALGDKIDTSSIENVPEAPTPNAPPSNWYAPATS
jgi:basic membrane protein A